MTGDTGGWYRSRALPQRAVPASSNVQLGHFTAIICSSRKGWYYPFQCLPKTHLIQSIAYSKAFVRHLQNVRFSEFEWAKLLYNFSFNRIEILVLIQSTTATITYPSAALGRIWLTIPCAPYYYQFKELWQWYLFFLFLYWKTCEHVVASSLWLIVPSYVLAKI